LLNSFCNFVEIRVALRGIFNNCPKHKAILSIDEFKLVQNITGIIDWGDITKGDIATDLAAIWMLFSRASAREQVIKEYGDISEATLQRAKGWAILFGVLLLDTGLIDNPRNAVMGERVFCRLLEDGE
jgi:hypothetical protein